MMRLYERLICRLMIKSSNKIFKLEVHIHEENQGYLEEQEGEEGC